MPRYTFTGPFELYAFGLQYGVNASVVRGGQPFDPGDGQTVVLAPGDELTTTDPYEHADLAEVIDPPPAPPAPPAAPAAPAPTTAAPAEETPA